MNRGSALSFALVVILGAGGCSAAPVTEESIDNALCVESFPVLRQITEVLNTAGGSPVALHAYLERMTYLQGRFVALEPRGRELAAAHQAVSDTIGIIIELVGDPDPRVSAALAQKYADMEIAAMDYYQACTA